MFTSSYEDAELLPHASENLMDLYEEEPVVEMSAAQLLEENMSDVCSSEEETTEKTVETEKVTNFDTEERMEEMKSVITEGTALENVFHGDEPQIRGEEPEEKNEVSGRWMENEESDVCLCCGKRFGVFRRRHVSAR